MLKLYIFTYSGTILLSLSMKDGLKGFAENLLVNKQIIYQFIYLMRDFLLIPLVAKIIF